MCRDPPCRPDPRAAGDTCDDPEVPSAASLKPPDGRDEDGPMGFLSRFRNRRTVDLNDRSPETGLKYKDLLVLEQLVHAGADMTAPRHVLYYLYFPTEGAATEAAAEAAAAGFQTDVRTPLPERSDEWALVCELHDHVLGLDDVRQNTDRFEDLAARHAGEYDGWEASV